MILCHKSCVIEYPSHVSFRYQLAFKKTIKVLGEGLGVKRRKKKAVKSPTQPDLEEQPNSRHPGDMVGLHAVDHVGVAAVASSMKNAVTGEWTLPASPDSSKSSYSNSSLWDISVPLVYSEHDGIPLDGHQPHPDHRAYGKMTAGQGTQNSTSLDTEWLFDCPGDALTKGPLTA